MNLAESVVEWVLAALPYDRSDPKVVDALSREHPRALLVLYFDWRRRQIPAQPRRVMRSRAFDQNPIAAARSVTIAEIVDDIERGADLTKYLSRRIRRGFTLPRKSGKKRPSQLEHLDLLLNDWGVHHLHLSTDVEAHGFVKRDDPLLLVMFRSEKAYFLAVGTHQSFADDQLVRIAVENWPEDKLFIELKGVLGSREKPPYSPEERRQLRSAGLASYINIDGRLFSPPGGITTAGTSTQASLWSGHVMRTLRDFEDEVEKDPSRILALIQQHGGKPGDQPEFKFAFFQKGFGVVEKTSGAVIGLGA
jgi:hypothetical protein